MARRKARTVLQKTSIASKSRRSRRYSEAERHRILETARREGLSGPKAAKKFGISTLTFYNWRKKAQGRAQGSNAVVARLVTENEVTKLMREQVRAQIRNALPEVIRSEVQAAFGDSNHASRLRKL